MSFKAHRLAAIALIIAAAPALAAPPPALDGTWTVDLTTNPREPYTKTMTLHLAEGGAVTGSFYDSTIEAGRWRTDRGRTCVSFRTTDGVGPYHTAACLVGDAGAGPDVGRAPHVPLQLERHPRPGDAIAGYFHVALSRRKRSASWPSLGRYCAKRFGG
jgi:hypothetical protein